MNRPSVVYAPMAERRTSACFVVLSMNPISNYIEGDFVKWFRRSRPEHLGQTASFISIVKRRIGRRPPARPPHVELIDAELHGPI